MLLILSLSSAITAMGDELKALLEAVTKLQPLLADPTHFSELKLLREQVDHITALAGFQFVPNGQASGGQRESVVRARPSPGNRRIGEPFEGGRGQPISSNRLKGEKFEDGSCVRGANPISSAGPVEEHIPASQAAQTIPSSLPTKSHGNQNIASLAGSQSAPDVCFGGNCGEPPPSTQSPGLTSRLPWDQAERIAPLVGHRTMSYSRPPWNHVEHVSFKAGTQPASSCRSAMDVDGAEKGVTPQSDRNVDARSISKDPVTERTYKTGKWTPAETLILVHLRRDHFVKYPGQANRRNVRASAAERWSEVEDEMFKRNIMRSKSQCQEKWEQLASDFRKVYDHQRNHVPLGEPGYFQMNSAERKERMLRFPKAQLDEAVYNALCEWYPRSSQVSSLGELPDNISDDVAAVSRGNLTNDAPASEEHRPVQEDGIGDSNSPHLTKRRRLSTKASEGAFSTIANNQKESLNVNSMFVVQDREDARHKLLLEMNAKKHRETLELKARIHQDKLIIEKERLQQSAALGQGYIAAMLSIADALKAIGESLKKDKSG
ncbi:uncharacterized protein [Physcomitrium patens]|uniref:uncharacterized protein isoform X6 n=1 Tax=Physcomitrium patens TaxID=3218 RepID=UPI00024AB0C4|nr:trihelix transcription factor ASR3-like isoform X5 [Physcomitrium patens]|eukprot:XP_024380229.1 trihelix transcription factor ASR3-like isoform X5 [Physcomitrella patens]